MYNSAVNEKVSKCGKFKASNMYENIIEVSSDEEFDFETPKESFHITFSVFKHSFLCAISYSQPVNIRLLCIINYCMIRIIS